MNTELTVAYTYDTPAQTPISEQAIKAVNKAVAFMESQGFPTVTVEVEYPINGKKTMYDYCTLATTAAERMTQLSNLTGTPLLSTPIHLTEDGMLLGVLFYTDKYQDRLLLLIW